MSENEEIRKGTPDFVIYETDNNIANVSVRLENETVWLTQANLSELFQTSRPNITMHIKNILASGELEEDMVCKNFLHTTEHGAIEGKSQTKEVKYYNLDMIISLGYRINSKIATKFRQWATLRLKEYIIKGFTLDDERLKNIGGGGYWHELLDRIRDIRSSEKLIYRQVLDLYALSIDYDPKAEETIRFFKIVQNKLHYATHGNTASEVIFNRADSEKEFMGLTNFKGEQVTKKDVEVAKNYLNETELRVLNNIVSGYFDFAEARAIEQRAMKMGLNGTSGSDTRLWELSKVGLFLSQGMRRTFLWHTLKRSYSFGSFSVFMG
ncbi:virulence RhuM family protein [Bacteroidales bacterium OttesenSCG-928-C03]|nr:virulence RhuM family protein [Bacteroidales bacterium OttesenSCG-928-C03]